MSKQPRKSAARAQASGPTVSLHYCAARFPKIRPAARGASDRARLIRENQFKWLNGTTLRYWFFDTPKKWAASKAEMDVVRHAFARWKGLGIGLTFVEVSKRQDADLRVAFDQTDGSWSYIGKDVRTKRSDPRTMNFGWSLVGDPDAALHEIGHTLGFPHEHQNPQAGIVWNEPAVYAALAKPPNRWSKATTFHNIIEKIEPDAIQGSLWDPNSIMHYEFERGLIAKPPEFRNGLKPAGGLSARDTSWALQFYPGVSAAPRALAPLQSVMLSLTPGAQADFSFTPNAAREFEFRTFGNADTVMALYDGARLLAEDDDSGVERNAYFKLRLAANKTYTLRVRLYHKGAQGETAVMAW